MAERMNGKWINNYFKVADLFASFSYCERAQVGAIIVTKDNALIPGFNGTPPGHINVCEGPDGETLPEVLHAELNAIAKLAKSNEGSEGAVMFITRPPCIECAKLILAAGIHTVFYIEDGGAGTGLELLSRHALVKGFERESIQ